MSSSLSVYSLPLWLEELILNQSREMGYSVDRPSQISEAILRASDYYIKNPDKKTPWDQEWCQISQLFYYLPLNFIRAQYVMDQAQSLDFFDSQKKCIEYGYGLGALTLHLTDIFKKVEGVEVAREARHLFQKIYQGRGASFLNQEANRVDPRGAYLCFSYSLTESISPLFLKDAEAVIIIEPSTHQDARKLQELRQKLIDQGFYAWAPCTHQDRCPLLLHSKKDWCHHRILTQMPSWFLKIEERLPFKNKTLTLSYLLMSKKPPVTHPSYKKESRARIIGDVLAEKGKTKALICRGEEREFLSVLHRDSKNFPYKRGDIVLLKEDLEKKGNEVRLSVETKSKS